jgi:dihydrofolate reductase
VVSQTLNKLNWNNSFLIKSNVVEEINKLKELDGPELHIYGSSNLIKTLVNANLVDLLKVWIFPVAVGKGKQLFGEGINAAKLKLVDAKTSSTGVIISTYQPDGKIQIASVATENPSKEVLVRRNKLSEEKTSSN